MKNINIFSILALCILVPNVSFAFGSKRKSPPPPSDTQAYPTRDVAMGKFLDTTFTLPDGTTKVDMSVHLPALVVTEMAQSTNKLRPTIVVPGAESSGRFIFQGGISSFEASAFSGSIQFGYKPGVGDIGKGVLDGATGKVTFTIGTLGMDFYVFDTARQNEVVAVGHGSALTGGVSLKVDLDFGAIKTPADFVYRSPMAGVFKSAISRAIRQMVSDPKTNSLLDWTARITAVNCDLKKVFFDSGQRDDVFAHNVFTVYDHNNMRIGEIKVDEAQHEQSVARFKSDSGDKLIRSARPGDAVKIYYFRK